MTATNTRFNGLVLFAAVILALPSPSALARQAPTGQPPASQPPAGQPPTPPSPAASAGPTGFSTSPTLKFRAQEIVTDFGVGYAVVSGDVNGDKLLEIGRASCRERV